MEPNKKVPEWVRTNDLAYTLLESQLGQLRHKGYLTSEQMMSEKVALDFEFLWLRLKEDTTNFTVKVIWDTYYALPEGIDEVWFKTQMNSYDPESGEKEFEEMRTSVPKFLREQGNEELALQVEAAYDSWLCD